MEWVAMSIGTVTAIAVVVVAIWQLIIPAFPLMGAFIWISRGQDSVARRAPSPPD